MPRRKIQDRNIRKITKSGGGSFYVTIPIEFMRELKWRERQKVIGKKRVKGLTIIDWKK